MSRARDISNDQANVGGSIAPYVAGKNGVINGGFDIWQRGTSISLAASTSVANGYTADRWGTSTGTNQACTISRQATSDTTNLPNIQYCLRFQRNSGQTGTGALPFVQSFESVNSISFAGKTVTLSFYARAGANYSATSNALVVYIPTGTGTDQNRLNSSYTGDNISITTSVTLTTTWQRFTLTGTIPTTATELATYFIFTPTGTAGTNDYFEITGVQLEIGSIATPFSRAGGSIGGELALCQRYYWRQSADASNQYATFGQGYMTATNNFQVNLQYPVTMRVAPTAIDYSNINVWNYGFTSYAVSSAAFVGNRINNTVAIISLGVTGATAGQAGILSSNNSTSGYFGLTAEL